MPLSREPQLDPSDIRLLRVFRKVVECGGFSNAQAELNVSASTISTQMTTLESRLGMRLCDRGRVGFRLTDKGRRVHAATLRLEEAVDAFRTDVGELRGKLVGELHIGTVDSTVTHADARLHHAVHVTLHVAEPALLEKRLLGGELHVGIAAYYHHVPGLAYETLFYEDHGLYCGRRHPLFDRPAAELGIAEVSRAAYWGVRLVTVAEGEISDLHVGLKGTMNALYLKDLAQKTHRGLEGRVRDGMSGGGLCYGYDLIPGRTGERQIDQAEAPIVRWIFEQYAIGRSPRDIAKQLNQEGVPGPFGRPWRDTAIRGHITRGTGILNNELYIGRLVWNRLRYVKDPVSGRRRSP